MTFFEQLIDTGAYIFIGLPSGILMATIMGLNGIHENRRVQRNLDKMRAEINRINNMTTDEKKIYDDECQKKRDDDTLKMKQQWEYLDSIGSKGMGGLAYST